MNKEKNYKKIISPEELIERFRGWFINEKKLAFFVQEYLFTLSYFLKRLQIQMD